MASDLLLTRDEVMGGLPAKRAAALLFLIESRTAHIVQRARNTMTPFQSEDAVRDRELAFVEAFALGREPPLRPTVQDLDRLAPQWADLVPDNPRLRAAVAHLLGQKYQFTGSTAPGLRQALGLDNDAVRHAYQRLYREPLDSIFAERPSLANRLRWTLAAFGNRLESLPPFWTAFALTLTETVGAGILALPIALAGVGPLVGIALLVVFGVVNVITITWIAEAAARTASIRYGGAYFGRFVNEYLGSAGSMLLTFALVIICASALLAYAIGLATTLESATSLPAAAWIIVLAAVVAYTVSRESLSSTIASALGIGVVNIILVLALAALGFAHVSAANLTHMEIPGINGQPFELSLLGLIFGIILVSFFGHTSVGNCAAVVLQRDPSARSLIWGVAAAQVTAIAIYSVWVLAINGAIDAGALSGQTGTALEPLATVAGPAVYIFGSIFVVLAMGMSSIHMALGLVNIVRERLPRRSQPVVLLPRGQCRLVFEPRRRVDGKDTRIVLTYLGLRDQQPRFRLQARIAGQTRRADKTGAGPWSADEALDRHPGGNSAALDLTVESLNADENQARLRITSGLGMSYEGSWTNAGFNLATLLDVGSDAAEPDPDWTILRWMLRQGAVSLDDAAGWAEQDASQMRNRLQNLVDRGAVREDSQNGTGRYRAVVAHRRARQVPDGLQQASPDTQHPARLSPAWSTMRTGARRIADLIMSGRGRRMLEYSPVALIILVAEWLVLSDRASFTSVLGFTGVIAVPIFAGLFPCLLLVSSRRKGDLVPGMVSRILGQAWLTFGMYTLFLVSILLHGLVIWQQPAERAAAIFASVIALGVTIVAIRQGAFTRRTVVTLRDDQRPGKQAGFEIVSNGRRTTIDAQLDYDDGARHVVADSVETPDFASLRQIVATLPPNQAPDLKVWANRITPEGLTESLPAQVGLTCGVKESQVDLRLAGGNALLSRGNTPCEVTITLDRPNPPAPAQPSRRANARKAPIDAQSLLSPHAGTDTLPTKGDRQ